MATVDGGDAKLSNLSPSLVGILKIATSKCLKLAAHCHSLILSEVSRRYQKVPIKLNQKFSTQ